MVTTRTYSDPSLGGHKTVYVRGTDVTVSTNSGATTIAQHTFMYPCEVLDWNVAVKVAGIDYSNATAWNIGKSLGGTGTVGLFGTADMLGATGTHAANTTVDASVTTATSFVAGDDVVVQLEGTGECVGDYDFYLEVVEKYVQSDT
jgi:hypothetical protein